MIIKFLDLRVTRHGNYFPAPTGISKHYSPYTIVSGKQVDYKKELVYSFGDYVQANTTHLIKNNNLPRTLDCIYLRANDALQGSHQVMNLATGRVIARQSAVPTAMPRMVIDCVELLTTRQGYKTLKFFNRKKNELMLSNADLLKGVDGNVFINEENVGVDLPLDDDGE